MAASSPDTAGPVQSARAALRRGSFGVDVALVAALAALGAVSGVVLIAPQIPAGAFVPAPAPIVLWAVGFCLPLLVRRRLPCTVLLVVTVHFPVYWPIGQPNEIMSWLVLGVGAYSATAYGRRRRALWCLAVALGLTTLIPVVALAVGLVGPARASVLALLNALPFVVGGSLGTVTRHLRDARAELEQRNAELAARRRSDERRAVLEERVRIARELHDVVAHHVALMGIQAGVAHRLFDDRPDDARAAVADVQAGGRRAVAELQRTIGVLRAESPTEGPDEPSPGLDRLPSLVEQVRRAGLPVELRIACGDVDAGLGLSAYRIVQEALTNTLKHAGAGRATVDVRRSPGGVEVEVVDDGRGAPEQNGGGRGLVGIRERVALHGGRLDAGPVDGGGYRVHAVLGRG